jgi:iron complex outermembrane receptor protein
MNTTNIRNPIAKAIKYALLAGAVLSTISATSVYAAEDEEDDESINKVIVTGSRISRGDIETALPITTITAEDIAATGLPSIGEVIAQLPFNSQGSFVSSGTSSASNHSSSGLRGLGSSRTLTLIDGKRIAPSPTWGTGAVNLNMIPLEAVERIDVLRDGAAAIYGSDAIGGVINIVLKKDYEGIRANYTSARPSRSGGDEDGFSLTMGSAGEKGSYIAIFEHKEWEGILNGVVGQGGDRGPIDANFDEGWRRSTLYSPHGTYRDLTTGQWVAGAGCPDASAGDLSRVIDLGDAGTRCGYAYYGGKNYTPKRQKDSLFANFTYNINADMMLETTALVVRDTTLTGSTSVVNAGNAPSGTFMSSLNPNNPTFGTAGATDIRAYHRFVGVADRKTEYTSGAMHFGTTFSWAIDDGMLSVSASASRQDVDSWQEHYTFPDAVDAAIENPDGVYDPETWYNPFVPGGDATEETLNSFLHTSTRRARMVTNGADVQWGDDTGIEIGGGTIAYAVGAEFQNFSFIDQLDRQSSPGGNAYPTFGGNDGGSRDYWAAYMEADFPVTDDINIKVATRYDKYSLPDKGQLSSSLNVRWDLTEDLMLRASYSEGFRAPSVSDLLAQEALSFNTVTDTTRCNAGDINFADGFDWCGDGVQIQRRSAGSANLGPETSEQNAFGIVWTIMENMSLTLDYYDIQINDQVQFLGAQDIVDLEAAGLLSNFDSTAIFLIRDADNLITNINTSAINQVGTSTSGIDMEFDYRLETDDLGALSFGLAYSFVLDYETQDTPLSERYEEVGSQTTPEYRYNATLGWQYDNFNARLTYRYITSYSDLSVVDILAGTVSDDGGMPAWDIIDLSFNYDLAEYGRVNIGVRNLTDEMPNLNRTIDNRIGFDQANQDILGRVVTVGYTLEF